MAMAAALAEWAATNRRRPPWRVSGDIYTLGVAQVLLQKTKGEDVEPVWTRVVSRYPNAAAMADAEDAELRGLIQELGLGNQRTQRLKAMAGAVRNGGCTAPRFQDLGPMGQQFWLWQRAAPLRWLQSMAISQGLSAGTAVSLSHRGEPRKKPIVRDAVAELLATQATPLQKLQLVYALVDLGATICRPGKPSCAGCPLSSWCTFTGERAG